MMRDKDEGTSDANSLPRLDVENDEIITNKIVNNTAGNNEQSEIELSESDLQLQVITNVIVIIILKLIKIWLSILCH